MKRMTKAQKDRTWKGALVGGVTGACLGVPLIGAAAGGYIGYNNAPNKKRKR